LALGEMATPDDPAFSQALRDYHEKGRDQQAKYFALISIGRIGGDQNRSYLLREVETSKSLVKPWAALALGVMDHLARLADREREPDRSAGEVIREHFQRAKAPNVVSGLAIALGLLNHTAAADDILDKLDRYQSNDELAGYCCVALGLMNHKPAKDKIADLVDNSLRRQDRLRQAAIALGLLGDKTAADTLVRFIKEHNSLAVYASVATALGFIGDRRTIDPLVEFLFDPAVKQDIAKAFAVVALGIVADKEEFPWNSKIGQNMNYRANTETLTNGSAGVLDIL
jgi:HEAT repeat protein